MSDAMIALYDADGKHVATVANLDGVDMTGLTSAPVARGEEPQQVEAELLALIERERQEAVGRLMTPGKDMIYVGKQAEVTAYDAMTPSEAAAMKPATVKQKFPYASAEMALKPSLKLADVIAVFRSGAQSSTAGVARIEALAQAWRAAVRSAKTADEKLAAFSSIPST